MNAMSKRSERMLRVDQAGEFGANRIYAGQLAVMGTRGPHSTEIAGMAVPRCCSRCGRPRASRWARRRH
jgi:demethoxyubiquinone hydroxylase (CLK1/Coq7/Cat5 family)